MRPIDADEMIECLSQIGDETIQKGARAVKQKAIELALDMPKIKQQYAGEFLEIICNMYSGKPYYEIKYISTEDGEIHIGYSSYKLECISEFLREYFMPTVKQKHGHWKREVNKSNQPYCSECGATETRMDIPYCWNCGAKMDEVANERSKNVPKLRGAAARE